MLPDLKGVEMSAKPKNRVRLLSGRRMTRGFAGLLAFGLLLSGGVAVAAPEEPLVADVVAAEPDNSPLVETAPVELAAPVKQESDNAKLADPVQPTASAAPAAATSPSQVSDVVEFKDANLKACIADALGHDLAADITKQELANLNVELDCSSRGIVDITPLQYATSLWFINLANNEIVDISPLENTALIYLVMGNNKVVDASPLAGMDYFWSIDLSGNQIVDVSPFAEIGVIEVLNLNNNQIVDVSPLEEVDGLDWLYLAGNRIVDASAFKGNVGYFALDLRNQRIRLDDVTSGAPFALPKVIFRDDSRLPLSFASGKGSIDGDTVTWSMPEGGQGALTWSKKYEREWAGDFDEFSGTITQNVLPAPVVPGDVVEFKDANLKKCLAEALGRAPGADITKQDLAGLTQELDCSSRGIVDITPLQYATGLWYLNLGDNKIVDISPLAAIPNVSYLLLNNNKIVNVSSLTGFEYFWELNLSNNRIVDVSPLAGIDRLEILNLSKNRIVDLSSLVGFSDLETLNLSSNRIVDVSPLANFESIWTLNLANNRIVDVSPLAKVSSDYLILGENRIADVSPLKGTSGYSILDLSNQKISLADATSGVPFTLPKVRFVDGTSVPLTIALGNGKINAGTVTWNMPKGGDVVLTWSQELKLEWVPDTYRFSGTITQKVRPATPIKSATPTISGTAQVGKKLTANPGKWTEGATFAYQWLADGKAIKGATAASFTVKAAQQGKAITVTVTGTKAGYTTVSKTSAKTGAVAKGTLTAGVPKVSGSAKVGSTLTAAPGKWTSGTKFTYQWLADGKAIKGATKSTYKVTSARLGERISVKVTGSKAGYKTISKISKATGKVTPKA